MVLKRGDIVIGKSGERKNCLGTINKVTTIGGKRKFLIIWENGDEDDLESRKIKQFKGSAWNERLQLMNEDDPGPANNLDEDLRSQGSESSQIYDEYEDEPEALAVQLNR
jgi:hypothetical protein